MIIEFKPGGESNSVFIRHAASRWVLLEFNLHTVCLLSAGTVCFYPRRLGGSHLVRRDRGGGGSTAQVRGRAADPGACWEDASGQTVQGEQLVKVFTVSAELLLTFYTHLD